MIAKLVAKPVRKQSPSSEEPARKSRGAARVVSVRLPLDAADRLRRHVAATGESASATVARLVGTL